MPEFAEGKRDHRVLPRSILLPIRRCRRFASPERAAGTAADRRVPRLESTGLEGRIGADGKRSDMIYSVWLFALPAQFVKHPEAGPVDRNFGIALSLWDWLPGTAYASEGSTPTRLGFEDIERFPKNILAQTTAPRMQVHSSRSSAPLASGRQISSGRFGTPEPSTQRSWRRSS